MKHVLQKSLLGCILAVFLCTNALAQGIHHFEHLGSIHCINDYIVQQRLLKKDGKKVVDNLILYEKELKQMIQAIKDGTYENPKANRTDTTQNGRKIIPVVVHVIHKYNTANITDAQIHDAIELLNIDYNKMNSDTDATHSYPGFASRRADIGVEFRLATIDPDGNCTNGIERVYDPQTDFAYFETMIQYAWPVDRYMNIYSVSFIHPDGMYIPENAVIGGMSPFPPSNPLAAAIGGGDPNIDGVLLRHDCLGSIGTATNMGGQPLNHMNRTFTHETGHYFNLYHPFQNLKLWLGILPVMGADGCSTSGMGGLVALNGDEVADTPPVKTASQATTLSCAVPGSINSCPNDVPGYGDEPDMIENYMDYNHGFCNNIFTLGQFDRMKATLMGDRRKLWSYENLVETGVWDNTTTVSCQPYADFYADAEMICVNTSITFTDASFNGTPTSWEWTFQGGSPATSTEQNPTVTYATAGIFDVTLKVTNAHGNDTKTKTQSVFVADPANAIAAPMVQGFESITLNPANGWIVKNENGNPWEVTTAAAAGGSKSIRVDNFEGNRAGSNDELITPIYDLSAPISGMYRMFFDLAYVGKKIPENALATLITGASTADTIYDNLQVLVSTNCGRNWMPRYTKSGQALSTGVGIDSNAWTPTGASDWRNEMVILSSYTGQTNVRFKFLFRNRGGNNIFIDNISLGDGSSSVADMIHKNMELSVYPNPVVSVSEINFSLVASSDVTIELYDILGKKVQTLESAILTPGHYTYPIHAGNMEKGMYILKVTAGGREFSEKLFIN